MSWKTMLAPLALCLAVGLSLSAGPLAAAPYAAVVMDARTGEILHEENARARLHPASLTKMMTLYIAFEAVRLGEINLDTPVKISQNAASEQPSRLGLRAGQRVELRYLIRAAAVKSANDAATAIGEAISGSEAAFSRRMNRTAVALGMTRTNFRNAHGLTRDGHLSTAYDMTLLGRRLLFDYPQYYNLFSRQTTVAMGRTLRNTNHRLLKDYPGADGIKTGYTVAAGFNLVASAIRGNKRVIATVFGGRSSATRNARVAELLDLGFSRASSGGNLRQPILPSYEEQRRGPLAVSRSLRPMPRPDRNVVDPDLLAAQNLEIAERVAGLLENVSSRDVPDDGFDPDLPEIAPAPRPDVIEQAVDTDPLGLNDIENFDPNAMAAAEPDDEEPPEDEAVAIATPPPQNTLPALRPRVVLRPLVEALPQVVARAPDTGPPTWSVQVGQFTSNRDAERALLRIALRESAVLSGAARKVAARSGRFEARFTGLSAQRAERVCLRLQAQNLACTAADSG